ncbi:MAG: hypothetical protein GXO25_05485 [Euryarchaeota archaeon]|nr:hypothetical protein [Euryarchaeota archaeon]
MRERKLLIHIRHTWMDVFKFPIVVEIVAIAIIVLGYFASNAIFGYFIEVKSIWDWIYVISIFSAILVLLPGFIAFVIWKNDMHLDEYVYLEGDEIVLKHGDKEIFRGKAENLRQLWMYYAGPRLEYFYFKFNKKFGKYDNFSVGDGIIFRKWISKEELEKKGFEWYNLFKKYNPDLMLVRPGKKPEVWNGKEWEQVSWNDIL